MSIILLVYKPLDSLRLPSQSGFGNKDAVIAGVYLGLFGMCMAYVVLCGFELSVSLHKNRQFITLWIAKLTAGHNVEQVNQLAVYLNAFPSLPGRCG
jgi:hypothetical protein